MNIIKSTKVILLAVAVLSGCATQQKLPLREGIANFQQQNYQSAFTHLYPLAIQGNSDAQYAIGYILYYGKTGTQDKTEGSRWIRKAAEQGNSLAKQAITIISAQVNFSPEED